MFCLNDTMRYWLCPGRTDMRKGISSLCGVVHERMKSEVRNGDVFIFIGRDLKLMKLLHAEDGGMVMYVKRLEAGRFKLPDYDEQTRSYRMEWRDLVLMVEGIETSGQLYVKEIIREKWGLRDNTGLHIRRHFEQALDENRGVAEHALGEIQHLYRIEHMCDDAELSFDERRRKRQELARPIMEAMRLWMEAEGVKYSERSLTGKAITYAYTRWDNMMQYLDDGRILLDNNLAENEIRPITLSRKNYLFCGNHEAAGNMAVICSLLATCKAHNVTPRLYLNSVIADMPYQSKATKEELLQMLPHKWINRHHEAILKKEKQDK